MTDEIKTIKIYSPIKGDKTVIGHVYKAVDFYGFNSETPIDLLVAVPTLPALRKEDMGFSTVEHARVYLQDLWKNHHNIKE